jgi:phospholipase/carboxylesterase
MSTANPHLVWGRTVTGPALARASLVVVVVHGRGQDPNWMLQHLVRPVRLAQVAWVLPAADDNSWYPNRFFDPHEANEPWLGHSLAAIGEAVRYVEDSQVPVERIALAGFSQGACLVAEFIATDPRPLAAAAILTGGVFGSEDEIGPLERSLRGMPILVTGHYDDEWVPVARVEETARLLHEAGGRVRMTIHDDPHHQINDDEVSAVRDLLLRAGA